MSRVLNKMAKTAHTWNGAVSCATTGTSGLAPHLDYFAKCGTYTGRSQADVDADMGRIFSTEETTALRIVFGLRLITRKPKVDGIEDIQTGYGRRDEFYKALKWLKDHRPGLLEKNLHLIPVFGSWKDLFTEELLNTLNRDAVFALVRDNLGDPLLLKYLPQLSFSRRRGGASVRARRDGQSEKRKKEPTQRATRRVEFARDFCRFLGISRDDYRRLKREGPAHIWQRQMGRGEWDKIHFNGVPGKAMLQHVSRKGKDGQTVFERHGQIERLKEWVLGQKTVKFTGYPYELTRAASKNNSPTFVQKVIYDRQFESMLEPMQGHKLGNVLACIDTSGSMMSQVLPNVSAYDICLSMGLSFSAMNVGHFKDAVVAFDADSTLVTLKGGFCDRLHYLEKMTTAWGNTNFQSVINLLVKIRKQNPDIPVDEFPDTILVISDMQFDAAGRNRRTNHEMAVAKLTQAGLPNMRFIWWIVNGATKDFPSTMDDKGVYMISGFDPVNIKALMGLNKPAEEAPKDDSTPEPEVNLSAGNPAEAIKAATQGETPLDGMKNFLSQPIFDLIQV